MTVVHASPDQVSPFLEIGVCDLFGRTIDTETVLERGEVDLDAVATRTHLGGELFSGVLREVGGDMNNFTKEIEIGGERADRGVDEHQILYEQHQLFGQASAVTQQQLDELLQFLDQLVGGELCWVERSMVESEVCLLYTSPSPRDATLSRMPSSA